MFRVSTPWLCTVGGSAHVEHCLSSRLLPRLTVSVCLHFEATAFCCAISRARICKSWFALVAGELVGVAEGLHFTARALGRRLQALQRRRVRLQVVLLLI